MVTMIERKDGTLVVFGIPEINKAIRAAIASARALYAVPSIRHNAISTSIVVKRDGAVALSVGLIYPDGWRQQHEITLSEEPAIKSPN